METTEPTPDDARKEARKAAAQELRDEVMRVAVAGYGATRTETPIEGFRILTRSGLDDPLAGVRAAILVRDVGQGQIRRWVDEARAAGKTWAEVAEVLGIEPDNDSGNSPAELAYLHIVEHEPLPATHRRRSGWGFDRSYTGWRCTSCGETVVDRGPFESHPDDNEPGHAESCARHTAAVAAWKKANDW